MIMSLMLSVMLYASTEVRAWGGNGKIVKRGGTHKGVLPTLAFVGIVAGFKKKGIELTPEEEAQFKGFDEILKQNFDGVLSNEDAKKQFDDLKALMTPEALKKLVDEANKEVDETLKKQSIAIDQLKNMGIPGAQGKGKSLKDQIREGLAIPANAEMLKNMKLEKMQNMSFNLEIKASDMTLTGTTAYTTAGTSIAIATPEVIPGLNNIARNQPFIMQLLNVMGTSSENIIYSEKLNVSGTAGWVAEDAASSQVSFDIQLTNSRAKMVSAYIEVATQMLDDIEYMASEIEKELIYQIAIKIDTWLLTGDGTANSIKGIQAFASAYVLSGSTAVTTTTPNTIDVIMAMATQISYDNFRPDIAVINTIDYNQTKLLKGTTGYYIINPNAENSNWGGIRVVASNQVPVGTVMVMDSSKTNVYRYQDFTLSYGWINDNFIKHMVTIQAQQRLHSFVKVNDANAFCMDTIANVKAAITAI